MDRLLPPVPSQEVQGPPFAPAAGSSCGLGWPWLEVLWTRGLQHEHQQVGWPKLCGCRTHKPVSLSVELNHPLLSRLSRLSSCATVGCIANVIVSNPPLLPRCLIHLQVQRAVLESFLSRCWQGPQQQQEVAGSGAEAQAGASPSPLLLAAVPQDFVLTVLLPAAGQAHLWRGNDVTTLQRDVAAWVGQYTAAIDPTLQQQLLLALCTLLASRSGPTQQRQRQLLRPFAQTAAAALAAAAQNLVDSSCDPSGGTSFGEGQPYQQWQALFLTRLQEATAGLGFSWGCGTYAAEMCSSLLQAAAAVAPMTTSSSDASQALLPAIGAWLQQVPLPLLLPGGALWDRAAGWLAAGRQQQQLTALGRCIKQWQNAAVAASAGSSCAATGAEEWQAWEQQASGFARLALLLASLPATDISSADATSAASQAGGKPLLSVANIAVAMAPWQQKLEQLYRRLVQRDAWLRALMSYWLLDCLA